MATATYPASADMLLRRELMLPLESGDASQIALQGQTDRREVEVAFNGRTPPPHRNPLICNQNGKFVSVQWERKAYGMAEDLQSGQTG